MILNQALLMCFMKFSSSWEIYRPQLRMAHSDIPYDGPPRPSSPSPTGLSYKWISTRRDLYSEGRGGQRDTLETQATPFAKPQSVPHCLACRPHRRKNFGNKTAGPGVDVRCPARHNGALK